MSAFGGNGILSDELEKLSEDTEELTKEDAEFLDEEIGTDSAESEVASNEVSISSGQALSLGEVIKFTAKKPHKVILVAGSKESGKTSLIANYFLDFQFGKAKAISFAGSRTLVGFEQRCWKFRTASMRMVPKTPRTSLSDSPYLHLQISNERKLVSDLLFCDIAGEKFENASNSESWAKKLKELVWANHFVLLVDGLSLRLMDKRQSQSSRVQQLLCRLIDSQALSNSTSIEIVFSKADLFDRSKEEIEKIARAQDEEIGLEPAEKPSEFGKTLYYPSEIEETHKFIDNLKSEISTKLIHRGYTAEFFFTSAHNIYGSNDSEFDNYELFDCWLNKQPDIRPGIKQFDAGKAQREIYKFREREISRRI